MTTTTDKTYNGWTNYETWNVKLWIDNDEGSYNYWRDNTSKVVDGNTETETLKVPVNNNDKVDIFDKDAATYQLAHMLKDFVEENNPLTDNADMYTDLLGAAISEINWYEIAKSMIEDY